MLSNLLKGTVILFLGNLPLDKGLAGHYEIHMFCKLHVYFVC